MDDIVVVDFRQSRKIGTVCRTDVDTHGKPSLTLWVTDKWIIDTG
jgi:hypothetical protein